MTESMSETFTRRGKILGRIETDTPCDKCGYNLYSQPIWMDDDLAIPILRCPECGAFQAAGRATGASNKWLGRIGAILIAGWVVFLLILVGAHMFAMGGLQVTAADEWYWRLNRVNGPRGNEEFVAVVFFLGLVVLSGAALGAFIAVFIWPAKKHGIYWLGLLAPWVPVMLILVVLHADRIDVDRQSLMSMVVVVVGLIQTVCMVGGFFIGRPVARWLLRAMVSASLVQYLACLWTVDGRDPPPPPKRLATNRELRAMPASMNPQKAANRDKQAIVVLWVLTYLEHTMPTDEDLKKAYKAFKKRLKLTRLDDESRLGRSPLTGGGTGIESIVPPREFGQDVWDELVKRGRITPEGDGFYRLGKIVGGL